MANIIDYVRWRGDIPMYQTPLGEVDALILSYLSYMPFDGLVLGAFTGEGVRLGDVCAQLLERGAKSACMIDSEQDDCMLLYELQKSERFAPIRLIGYINRYSREDEEQFSAVTFVIGGDNSFVAFRGTDSTVVGWKEDFNMSFSGEVPSQRNAYYYIQEAARVLGGRLILGGHSKGGNLAAYAGIFSPEDVQRRIVSVYNFDGPGFNESVVATQEFKKVNMRIRTYVPQSSLIGILLWHAEAFTVVSSDAVSVLQHNPYTWQVMGGKFITEEQRTRSSRFAEETLKHWLTSLAPQERRALIDGIYGVLDASQGRSVAELFEPRNIISIVRAAGNMDEKTRETITEAFRLLGGSIKETLPEWIDRTAAEIRGRITGEILAERDENA
ncbi:MAG: DUF2974 domain-containing protein [Clostridia bacterium]|nr:DUF2974 domain-containing protein [Clostridia bacterium]